MKKITCLAKGCGHTWEILLSKPDPKRCQNCGSANIKICGASCACGKEDCKGQCNGPWQACMKPKTDGNCPDCSGDDSCGDGRGNAGCGKCGGNCP